MATMSPSSNIQIFPARHTTTTTTTIRSSETQVDPTIRFDQRYLYTLNGQLKMAEIILSFVALLFVSFSQYYSETASGFFEVISISAVWWTTILLILYLFHVIEKFYKVPWLKVEMLTCIVFAALFFLDALVALITIPHAVFFVILLLASGALAALFAYDAYLKLLSLQAGEVAQGIRVVSQVTEVGQPPVYRY